ncbi:hypothetical protein SAMN04488498_13816 [Mesorhizobium albiziae]|uniref:Uncharacterized protein n=1 Tax=Neomesorhizobium albiziae TaxID=335020 RepID=A0A1I4F6F1_9HYPH|nr:hypothetical protein SAMN04488498_13816 [Mesorhizobium albiziae]
MLESLQAFPDVAKQPPEAETLPAGVPESRTGTAKLGEQLVKQFTISRGRIVAFLGNFHQQFEQLKKSSVVVHSFLLNHRLTR